MSRVELPLLREILSVAQVGLAVVAVWLGTGGSWWAILGAVALTVIAYLRPLPEAQSVAAQRMWTVLVFFALVASIARGVLLLSLLDAGIDFLLLLCVQRFFNRQKTREHLQLQMLAAVLMVIAAVINTELSYPVILVAYLPLAVMGLLVNLLMGEGERLGARVQFELRRSGKQRQKLLWMSALQVAGAAALAGLVVFVAFPRFGIGMFLRGAMQDRVHSGFSEQVRLGGFGTIKTDATVVMRIELDDDTPVVDRVDWHLRGSAFDRYDDGLWSHSGEGEQVDTVHSLKFRIVEDDRGALARTRTGSFGRQILPELEATPVPGFAASTETLRAVVTLEDFGTDLLFAASEPLAVGMHPRGRSEEDYGVALRSERQFAVTERTVGPVRYVFFSRPTVPSPPELRAVGEPPVPASFEPYLQVSAGLSPEVAELAREITADATTRYDKVAAVSDWLGQLEYTLDQPYSARVNEGADPLEGFLFETRAGHCEYFATAMAVLLREVGVPTRNVNGYYGAEWNPVGEYYTVRQANAHSWVEVYFDDLGWVTFDPTPPSGRNAGQNAAMFPKLAQIVDAMRNAYLGYVIDYDLGKQLSMLENLGVANRDENSHRREINWIGVAWWSALPLALVMLAILVRLARQRLGIAPELATYQRVLAAFARRGFERHPDESARRFAQRLTREGHPAAQLMHDFARRYEAIRFGPKPTPSQMEALTRAGESLVKLVRSG